MLGVGSTVVNPGSPQSVASGTSKHSPHGRKRRSIIAKDRLPAKITVKLGFDQVRYLLLRAEAIISLLPYNHATQDDRSELSHASFVWEPSAAYEGG